jgi:putative oxidoreductase
MQKIERIFRIIIAFIFIQSLYYKFTGQAVGVHIFSTIGMEPFGRVGVGISEIIVAILLFLPKTRVLSLLGSIVLMCGAIFFHLSTELGVVVHWDGQNDNGKLFDMGVTVLLLSSYMLIAYYKNNLPINSFKKIIGF